MGGAHDAHQSRLRQCCPPAHLALLDGAQQLHLQPAASPATSSRRGYRRGGLKEPIAIALGAGECTFAVAEELASIRFSGIATAVDGDKGAVGAQPRCMQDACGESLPVPDSPWMCTGVCVFANLASSVPQRFDGGRLADQRRYVADAVTAAAPALRAVPPPLAAAVAAPIRRSGTFGEPI